MHFSGRWCAYPFYGSDSPGPPPANNSQRYLTTVAPKGGKLNFSKSTKNKLLVALHKQMHWHTKRFGHTNFGSVLPFGLNFEFAYSNTLWHAFKLVRYFVILPPFILLTKTKTHCYTVMALHSRGMKLTLQTVSRAHLQCCMELPLLQANWEQFSAIMPSVTHLRNHTPRALIL
jgi:hypothetical protein